MANNAATINALPNPFNPEILETLAITAAGTTFSEVMNFRNLDIFKVELAVVPTAVVGGTLDITPQYSYDGGDTWLNKSGASTFSQWAAANTDSKVLTLADNVGKLFRLKYVAGAGVTSVTGKAAISVRVG